MASELSSRSRVHVGAIPQIADISTSYPDRSTRCLNSIVPSLFASAYAPRAQANDQKIRDPHGASKTDKIVSSLATRLPTFMAPVVKMFLGLQPEVGKQVSFDEKYYNNIINAFEYTRNEPGSSDEKLNSSPLASLVTTWAASDNLQPFLETISKTPDDALVVAGIGMSGTPHIGTVAQIHRLHTLASKGIPVQLILGDIDSLASRAKVGVDTTENLVGTYRKFLEATGWLDVSSYRTQSDHGVSKSFVLDLSFLLDDSDFTDMKEDLADMYEKSGDFKGMTFSNKVAITLMASDFLSPLKINNKKSVLVISSIDEHKYYRFASKLKDKLDLPLASSLSTLLFPLIPGLNSHPKMSKSFPNSGIHLGMSKDEIQKAIMAEKVDRNNVEGSSLYQMIMSLSPFSSDELSNLQCQFKTTGSIPESVRNQYVDFLVGLSEKWKASSTV
jgi:tryptophanyl-tRNA synthetase